MPFYLPSLTRRGLEGPVCNRGVLRGQPLTLAPLPPARPPPPRSRSLVLKQCLQLPVPLWREALCLMGGEFAEAARLQQEADGDSDED